MRRRRHRRNRHRSRRSLRYNRCHRVSRGRRSRRNRGGGSYRAFVKKHKGLFKRMSPKLAMKKIGSMWRHKH